MARERIYLFDTTLRDGQQTPGIDFSVEDKISIARLLDDFGFDYVEGGYPGANPTDTRFFEAKRTSRASFVAFGMTKRAGISVSNDPGMSLLLQAFRDAVPGPGAVIGAGNEHIGFLRRLRAGRTDECARRQCRGRACRSAKAAE